MSPQRFCSISICVLHYYILLLFSDHFFSPSSNCHLECMYILYNIVVILFEIFIVHEKIFLVLFSFYNKPYPFLFIPYCAISGNCQLSIYTRHMDIYLLVRKIECYFKWKCLVYDPIRITNRSKVFLNT